MLLKNNKITDLEYLKDWPSHYYEIPTAIQRKEALKAAESQGIAVSSDGYRRELCEKRFFSRNDEGTSDLFMYAWMMIRAASESRMPLFGMKKLKKELESNMEKLCLFEYETLCQEARELLKKEWGDFAENFINSCVTSKNYGVLLPWLGMGRSSDSAIAEMIAAEIFFVTREYPSHFDLDTQFTPLREVMCDTYCRMIENAEDYLREFKQA